MSNGDYFQKSETMDANGTTVRYGWNRYGWFTFERVEIGRDGELTRVNDSAVVSIPPDKIDQIFEFFTDEELNN